VANTPEEVLRARLAGDPTLSALVSGRINPQLNTQEVSLPFVAYKRLGGANSSTLSGPGKLGRFTFQVDVYAATEAGAAAVVAAVESLLFPAGSVWRDDAAGVKGCFPDDTLADATDDPWRIWTRVFGIWFQSP
jgi:hypothetical protein